MFSLKDVVIYCGYLVLVIALLAILMTLVGLAFRQNPRDWWKGFWNA